MLNIPIKFDDLLKVIDSLSLEQKRLLRQHLDEDWTKQFGDAQAEVDVQADVPHDLLDDEMQASRKHM